jgi:hypothetical protein
MGPAPQPEWFDEAIESVLDGAEVLASAPGPRALEQLTAELLGAELYRAVVEESYGLRFDLWLEELVAATAARVGETADEAAYLLLHGLASVATPGLASVAAGRRDRVRRLMGGRGLPSWLADLPKIAATGEVLRMRDAYGTRFAVIAGFRYPSEADPSAFLFDIDASGFVKLVDAGVYDDVDRAVDAWRANVGAAAEGVSPQSVTDPDQLLCLVHCDVDDEQVMGDESRTVLDNWFRAPRRIHDLAEALRRKGLRFPAYESLYHDLDTKPMVEQFSAWHAASHGTRPDTAAVEALAGDWVEGALPETWFSVSPRRVEFQLDLINDDWIPDDPITIAVKELLPRWVRWLTEQADLPHHLSAPTIAASISR